MIVEEYIEEMEGKPLPTQWADLAIWARTKREKFLTKKLTEENRAIDLVNRFDENIEMFDIPRDEPGATGNKFYFTGVIENFNTDVSDHVSVKEERCKKILELESDCSYVEAIYFGAMVGGLQSDKSSFEDKFQVCFRMKEALVAGRLVQDFKDTANILALIVIESGVDDENVLDFIQGIPGRVRNRNSQTIDGKLNYILNSISGVGEPIVSPAAAISRIKAISSKGQSAYTLAKAEAGLVDLSWTPYLDNVFRVVKCNLSFPSGLSQAGMDAVVGMVEGGYRRKTLTVIDCCKKRTEFSLV